jgi:hypothetical protein
LNGEFPLIGREAELARIRDAFSNSSPLLILGLPGAGKSRLLEAIRSETTKEPKPLTIPFPAHPHELLIGLATALLNDGHKAFGNNSKAFTAFTCGS